ncbi:MULTISPECIES: MAPEG family protein [Acinetobacter]|uniref:MAPEG family protein n=1 Tax=Acinetobacter corruptisaponis TaxID=3045147 RepID=A0ABY8S5K0_9GAMM|nr:MAPEG family protein [Acinetobacter sp. KCTC 92772]WHP04959.1 MAPEG family protein [Acinetobacter sp. KCTC 92772]
MNSNLILQPAMALALFTLTVLLLILMKRIRAAVNKQVKIDDFKYGESDTVPVWVCLPNRNFMNLLEVPILFYVVSIFIFITQHVDMLFVYLAWAYVVLRIIHSAIHLGYNNVVHRALIFGLSNAVLVIMWLRIAFISYV